MNWDINTEPKKGEPERPVNDESTSMPAGPRPSDDSHAGTLPGSSVPESELQKDADEGLISKGIFPGV